ncbi:hypothetical protein FIV42_27510 [Persicimonas caeni]|uniref:Sigma-54 factor interaction domain-containing protein n=1 Tax=Persicimonas caeni TaxID=2292766 RepID=A0A4Y6Q1A9_PERCE|nr:sigma 54-interacting transcriptional regulator [Persicimonas caeni]QDG54358.1 hypothetical protein FIV42_27510 [Persicimonas caeni]QED35579.1 hypothetical protein FRD00_27505 [Persicimonas caeni]
MKSNSPTSLIMWAVALLLAIASLVFGYLQLDGLPDLGVQFGPDLTVRSVSVDRQEGAERQEFKRGDRLVALEGQSVEDLRDLRMVLQNLPDTPVASGEPLGPGDKAQPTVAGAEAGQAEAIDDASRTASYQLVRPLHRFHITLQGELKDPTALPQGVEPTDRLIELDGRKLQTKVGPEAVRSIVASRPEALLVFERKNAVFSGSMKVPDPEPPYGVVGTFGLVAIVLIGLWWFRSRELEPGAVVAISLQTVCIGWIALLAFEYQWTLSDYGLTAAVIAGFALVRPFAFFARNIGSGYGTQSGWSSLAVGLFATGSVLGLLFGGYFESAEQALHVAALIAGLFVVYEIFLASIDDTGPASTLGEGTGYLAWILVLALFSALLAWYLAPISFEENRWRWFSAVIVGLVWFGDVLYCFRGPGASGYDAIAHKADRQIVVSDYLAQVRELVPEAEPFIVVATREESVLLETRGDGLRTSPTSEALHDAVSILIQEGVRVPLPDGIHRQAHPMGGIAKTMDMALALRLAPPEGGVRVDGVELVLVGIEESPAAELPVHPSNEILDALQDLLSGQIWTAALVEGLPELRLPEAKSPPEAHAEPSSISVAESEEVDALKEEVEELRRQLLEARSASESDSDEPATVEQAPVEPEPAPAAVAVTKAVPLDAPPADFEALLEPELVDALLYLLDSPEPIVLAGARGAGKTFTARCAHALEAHRESTLIAYDAGDARGADHAVALFGQPDDTADTGVVSEMQGGALLIQDASELSDTVILRLCQAAELGDLRLYLEFNSADAEERSVFDERSSEVRELLEHRELIIPHLSHRLSVLQVLLERFCAEQGLDDFTDEAFEALMNYDYPGEVAEAQTIVEAAVTRAEGEVITLQDLPDSIFETSS